MFALPWLLTWLAHDLNFDDALVAFDFFIAAPRLAPLYLAAAVSSSFFF
jgi:hypothetical protein